ncbi:MAG: ATP-binding protein, partial [Abditibacteriota bacterium]|nr:ATP-binding protein [Abditibacteriota bacterium]
LAALLETIAETKNREAAARNMTVRFMSDLKSFMYNAAPDRITQIVDNAAGNALTYAGEGSSVVISLEVDDDVKVKIADNGKGISSADLPFVTDAFYRASKSRTPGEGHSGLGLSIASRLAEAHGGTLTVESVEGRGTTVVLKLPKQS